MADKTLRINIATDVSELDKIKKELIEVGKVAEAVASKGDWSAFGGFNAARAKEYFDKLDTLQGIQLRNEKEKLDQSNFYAQAAINAKVVMYGNMFNSIAAMEEKAARRAKQAAADARGYIPNTSAIQKGDWSAFGGANTAIQSNTQALKANGAALQETERHTRNLFIRVGEAIGSYRIWNAVINSITSSPSVVSKLGIELDSTKASLLATIGSAAGAASALKALDDEAERTGINIGILRESFRGFQASTSLAGASLDSTWHMFTNLNSVITGLHLSADKANGIFLAMAQIFNKGKVQSEELVKQLGNLLPGAFASFATSMGILPSELSKQMKLGLVTAQDTMENFTTYINGRFALAFAASAHNLNANIGRMETSFIHLGEAVYKTTSKAMNQFTLTVTSMVKGITSIVDGTSKFSSVIGTGFTAAFILGTGALINYIAQLTIAGKTALVARTSLLSYAAATSVTNAAISATSLVMNGLKAAMAFLASPGVIVAGLVMLTYHMKGLHNVAQEATKSLREMLDTALEIQDAKTDPILALKIAVDNSEAVVEAKSKVEEVANAIAKENRRLELLPSAGINPLIALDRENTKKEIARLKEVLDQKQVFYDITRRQEEQRLREADTDGKFSLSNAEALDKALENSKIAAMKRAKNLREAEGEAELKYLKEHSADMNAAQKAIDALAKATDANKQKQGSFSPAALELLSNAAKEGEEALANFAEGKLRAIEEARDKFNKEKTTTINKDAKNALRDEKILTQERLDVLDSASKRVENITSEEITRVKALHEQGKTSNYEYQQALNIINADSLTQQQTISEQKLSILRNEKATLDAMTANKGTMGADGIGIPDAAAYEDAVRILEIYNKGLAENTLKHIGNQVALTVNNKGIEENILFTQKSIEEAKLLVAGYEANAISVDKLSDAQVRSKDVSEQIRTIEEEIAARKTEMANANVLASVELTNLKKEEINALTNERIKYLELTSQVYKAIEAKRELALITIEKSGVPQPIKDQQVANVEIQFKQENTDAAKAYQDQLDAINDSTREIGLTSTEAFDIVNKGFGGVAQTFKDFTKGLEKTAKALRDNAKDEREMWKNNKIDIKDKERLSIAFAKKNRELELDQFETAIGNTRQIATATAKMFDEKSAAAQGFNDLASALAVVEMAMEARKVALYVAGIIPKLAAGAATMFAQSGWGGFAGVAAMAAVMVGLGVNYAASGGTQAKPPSSTDTGTVLGDKTAKSESLTNIATLLEEIHAKEYRELRGINNGIIAMNKGVTDTITRMFQAGGLPTIPLTAPKTQVGGAGIGGAIHTGAVIGSLGLANFDPISKAIMGFLFGGKQTKTVVGQGIATGPSNVGNILNNDKFYASLYADIETKTKGGIFSKDKVRYERIYQQMDADTSDALTKVFRSMGQTMFSLAEQLGVGLGQRVKNYVIPALFIDLQGLNGEDAAKKVNGVISSMLDSMSTTVFGDIVGKYQKLGEGMLETAVRIIAEVAVVKDALGISGIELQGNAIAISDALVQAAGSIKLFQDQFENYYDAFYSNAEKQTRLYGKLSETFADVGSVVPQTRKAYRDMLEALDLTNEADRTRYSILLALSEAADTYYNTLDANKDTFRQAFHTEAENQARAYGQLSKQLVTVTLQLPSTREGFRKLVEGLDLTNTADRERYYLLLELSGAADSYYQSLEAVAAAQREAARAAEEAAAAALRTARAQARQDIEAAQQLKLANKVAKTDAAFAAYEKQLKNQLDATLKSIEAQKKVAQEIVSKWSELLGQLKSAKDSTVVDTLETSRLKRLMAEAVIAGAAATARAGGNVNTTGLADALTEITKPSENFYSSFEEYALAQAKAGNNIEDLNKHATKQKTDAEKTLERLDESAKAAQEYYNTSIATAREQIDAIRNVSRNILTLADAIAKEGAYRDKISKGPNQNLAILNAYENETGLTISASRMAHFQEVAKRRGLTQAELEDKIANSRDAQIADLFLKETGKEINANRMRRYLKILKEGGTMADVKEAIKLTEAYKNTHFSGLASVPYDGYQATLHKNEAVVDASSVSAIQRYFRVTPASGNNNAISEELLAELKLLRKTVEEQGKKLESIDKSSKSSADTLDKSSAGGPLLVQVV